MAVSYIDSAIGSGLDTVLPAHVAGDLIIMASRSVTATPPTPAVAGGTVPVWDVLQSRGTATYAWTIAKALALSSATTVGSWANQSQSCCVVLRAGAGLTPTMRGVTTRFDDVGTTTVIWPATTASVKNGTSLGVLVGMTSRNIIWSGISSPMRPQGPSLPLATYNFVKVADHVNTSFQRMGIHVSNSTLTADLGQGTSTDFGATSAQQTMSFEVAEVSPVMSGPRMML